MIGYLFRRWNTAVFHYACACSAYRCGRPRVGFAAWCRGHTDAILFGPKEQWPSREVHTDLYVISDEQRAERWSLYDRRRSHPHVSS